MTANEQIHAALAAYCRGVDRLDDDSLMSAFHPEAILSGYGRRDRAVEEFVPFAINGLRHAYAGTQHRLSNIYIEIDGNQARVESYVTAEHLRVDGETRRLHVFTGRYIDAFENISGRWAIRSRTLRHDWTHDIELTGAMPGSWTDGARDRSDVVYDAL
ncbi:MAG: hypothetical protein ACI8TP_000891 [Acidimicrobiales bacterium]|jgi:hypothetical protein